MNSHSLRDTFLEGCSTCALHPEDGPVIAGVSGGCDSIVLGVLLQDAGFQVIATHVNYGLRPEADAEEAFVRQWGNERGIEVEVLRAESAPSAGRQAWAREVRYAFFLEQAKAYAAEVVAVAHHADDQVETILLNLDRGTGPAGLGGMAPRRPLVFGSNLAAGVDAMPGSNVSPVSAPALVRPLLAATREDIEQFARREGIVWKEDPSNHSDGYTRNAIRKELAVMDPAARKAFRAAGMTLSHSIAATREKILRTLSQIRTENGTLLLLDDLAPLPAWLREWVVLEWLGIHDPGLPRRGAMAREVLLLQESQVGRRIRFGSSVIWRERGGLRMTRAETATPSGTESVPVPRPGERTQISFEGGMFVVERIDRSVKGGNQNDTARAGNPAVATIDARRVGSTLFIRKWQPGDRFQPLGMRGSKKVKSLLTDRKVPPSQRHRIPVVLSGTDIVWVAGLDIDDRFRVQGSTREIIRLVWTPEGSFFC